MPAKSPWTKPQMRETVNRAIARVGGPKAFDFMGRGMQEAVVNQELFFMLQDAAKFSHDITFDEIVATRRAAYEIAGLWIDGEHDD